MPNNTTIDPTNVGPWVVANGNGNFQEFADCIIMAWQITGARVFECQAPYANNYGVFLDSCVESDMGWWYNTTAGNYATLQKINMNNYDPVITISIGPPLRWVVTLASTAPSFAIGNPLISILMKRPGITFDETAPWSAATLEERICLSPGLQQLMSPRTQYFPFYERALDKLWKNSMKATFGNQQNLKLSRQSIQSSQVLTGTDAGESI